MTKSGYAILMVTLSLVCGVSAAAPDTPPKVTGHEPPAMAPYAENDPIPKVTLPEHAQPFADGRQAVETFLSLLSRGYHPGIESLAGGSIPGDDRAFEKAWELLGPVRQDWRVCRLKFGTEPLVVHNIGGHQGWQHSLTAILFIAWRGADKRTGR